MYTAQLIACRQSSSLYDIADCGDFLNVRESPRAASTPSWGICAGSTHTNSGISQSFGISNFPTTICFTLGANFIVSVVFTIHDSPSQNSTARGRSLLSYSHFSSTFLTFATGSSQLHSPFRLKKTVRVPWLAFPLACRVL
jgi:hypothetical protein